MTVRTMLSRAALHGVVGTLAAESDLVLRETTHEMMRRGPGTRGLTRIVEVPGCGHAPALNVPEQLDLVKSFIDQHDLPVIAPAAALS